MLKINYATSIENLENVNALFSAVTYESLDMAITLTKDAIDTNDKTRKSKDASPATKALAEEKIATLTEDLKKYESELAKVADVHKHVVSTIASVKNEHVQNNETSVRNVLRLTACGENYRYFSIAIKDNEELMEKLYNAFTVAHVESKCDENGHITYSKDVKTAYSDINATVQKILKDSFSIPVANEYTKKVNVKFNGTDLKDLHETFVTGLTGVATKDKKTGDTTWDCTEYKTAIVARENKKTGKITYKGQGFMSNVAKLAMKYICK